MGVRLTRDRRRTNFGNRLMNYRTLWVLFFNNFQLLEFGKPSLVLQKKYLILFEFFKNYAKYPQKILSFKTNIAYKFICGWCARNARTLATYSAFFGFRWSRFILFSGLGYKRRFYRKFGVIFNYIADRHWILYRFSPYSLVGAHRRRNFVLFSHYKGSFTKDYNFFSSLRRPYVYKMKGFIDSRVKGRFLFVRRIKIRTVRTKLSKKQKLL